MHTVNVESFDYNIEAWVGEAISKGMKRHQNAKGYDCGSKGQLRSDCKEDIPRNNVSSGNNKIEGLSLLDYVEDAAKANTGPMNVDQ